MRELATTPAIVSLDAIQSVLLPKLRKMGRSLLALQSISPRDDFQLAADRILDRNYRVHLEDERG